LPVATFAVDGTPHALVAARLAAEDAIGVRHGCFCAHPYLMRLLGYTREEVRRHQDQVRRGDRSAMPGAVRASAGINTTEQDIARLLEAVGRIAAGNPPPIPYCQDPHTGDYRPRAGIPGLPPRIRAHLAPCSPG
jgi:selenocysteine lyase/cysteine desulfurase